MATILGIAALALAALGAAGANLRLLPALVGFVLFALGALSGAAASVTGVVGFVRRREARALLGLGLGLPVLLALLVPAIRGRKFPRMNDISTSLDDPPRFVNAGDIPYPAGFVPVVRQHYPDLAPLGVDAAPDAVFQRAVRLARSRDDWRVVRVNETARELEAVATTGLFKFEDDVSVRVRPAGAGSIVDVRSRSRDGKGDFGVNAARIRWLLQAIKAG